MKVAIMQPTYIPWAGYFGLMMSVDLFIILDNVQFSHRSWQQRNQIKTAQGLSWLTVPVLIKGKRDQLIKNVLIDKSVNFKKKHKASIELAYKKSFFFKDFSPSLFSTLDAEYDSLLQLNYSLLLCLTNLIGLDKKIMFASELESKGSQADLLAFICSQVGATEYISPPGSKEYIDQSSAFREIGIDVSYFDYTHPEYSQNFGPFVPYMSVIDLIFNMGPESKSIIFSGLN